VCDKKGCVSALHLGSLRDRVGAFHRRLYGLGQVINFCALQFTGNLLQGICGCVVLSASKLDHYHGNFPSKEAQFNDLPTLADQVVVGTAVGEQISLLTHTPFTRNTHERYA
jgi:hypothetical protein